MLQAPAKTLAVSCRFVFEGCDAGPLDAAEPLERAARAACAEAGVTIVGEARHHYAPHGWTLVFILKESHLAVHTWPEHDAAVVELLSCRTDAPVERIRAAFERELGSERSRVSTEAVHVEA